MRKFTAFIAAAILVVLTFAGPAAAQEITIIVDGKQIQSDVPPYITSGRVMVPLRFVTEAFGYGVTWAPDAEWPVQIYPVLPGLTFGKGSVAKDFGFIGMEPNRKDFYFFPRKTARDGSSVFTGQISYSSWIKNFTSDVAPEIREGRTFVPLRVLSEAFGCQVDWNESTRTVTVGPPNVDAVANLSRYVGRYWQDDVFPANINVRQRTKFDEKGNEVSGYYAGPADIRAIVGFSQMASGDEELIEKVPVRIYLDNALVFDGVQDAVFSRAAWWDNFSSLGGFVTTPGVLAPGQHVIKVEVPTDTIFDRNPNNNVKTLTIEVR